VAEAAVAYVRLASAGAAAAGGAAEALGGSRSWRSFRAPGQV